MVTQNQIPSWMNEEYPFKQNSYKLSSGHNINYVHEGLKNKPTIIMLHGNPTWSFYYRNLIKHFSKTYQIIVPDHIGCGLSDKPQDYDYTLANHISNLNELLEFLNIEKASLIIHDWGGAIGFGLLELKPGLAEKVVILNTAAYTSSYIAPQINICRLPFIGDKAIRGLNAFAWPATFMAVKKPMRKAVKKGFLYPYNNYRNRIATSRFVQDIPMDKSHKSFQTLLNIEKSLEKVTCPKLVIWGKKDFCFNDYFLNRWKNIYPTAKIIELENAGHYVIEDETKRCIDEIGKFL